METPEYHPRGTVDELVHLFRQVPKLGCLRPRWAYMAVVLAVLKARAMGRHWTSAEMFAWRRAG